MQESQRDVREFYDELAEHYHLIFENWGASIARQAGILGPLIESAAGPAPLRILDCACGIGTQSIGFARRGHAVTASDLSSAAVARAKREAAQRELAINFQVADMRDLKEIETGSFDAAIAGDNALPHLIDDADLRQALLQIATKLRSRGVLLATMRDYDRLLQRRPTVQTPAFYSDGGLRRIVHQVWDWNEDTYALHLYLTLETGAGWESKHFVSRYRALKRTELNDALADAGFAEIRWLEPEESGFYQPIAMARKMTRKVA